MIATPEKQLCAWVDRPGPDATIKFRDIPVPMPGPDQIVVKLEASGVCHSDCHSIFGNTPMTAHIAGHEGVGKVISAGSNVSQDLLHQYVGISWLHKTCGSCEICEVDYTHCPQQLNSGRNVDGTFQQFCLAEASHVTRIPDGLSPVIAAPLLCGGVSMYGALERAQLRPRDWVVIPGAGGGLGHLGVQLAAHLGYRVIAVDSGEQKRALAMKCGADSFIDVNVGTKPSVQEQIHALTGIGAHCVVCVAGAPSAYDSALSMLRNCGKLVCVGIPPSQYRLQLNPFEMLVRGLKVLGSTVGNREQMEQLMKLALEDKVTPEIEVFEFRDLPDILKRLDRSEITGRAVIGFE